MFCTVLLAGTATAESHPPVRAAVKTLLPEAKIESIKSAPLAGVLEVVADGRVLYVSKDGVHVFPGPLFDAKTATDLSEQTARGLRKEAIAKLPETERMRYPSKAEAPTVLVFTDIDCGYCRRLHEQLGAYNAAGITVHYALLPRAGLASDSGRKATAVWCAADPSKAMDAAQRGEDPGSPNADCSHPIAKHLALANRLGIGSTPTMVLPDGSTVPGYLEPSQLLARLQQSQ